MQGTIDRVGLKIKVISYVGVTRDDILAAVRAINPVKLGVDDPTELNRHVNAMWAGVQSVKSSDIEFECVALEFEILTGDQKYGERLARVIRNKASLISDETVYAVFGLFGIMTDGARDFLKQGTPASSVLNRFKRVNSVESMRNAAKKEFRKTKKNAIVNDFERVINEAIG